MPFRRLHIFVQECNRVRLSTKLKLYHATAMSMLLYARRGLRTSVMQKSSAASISVAFVSSNTWWQEKLPDTEVLSQTSMPSIFTLLCQSQMHWAGHITRITENSYPKRTPCGKLTSGACSHSGHRKRFKDMMKASLKDFNINHTSWGSLAQDRAAWSNAISKGAAAYEQERIQTAQTKCSARKAREAVTRITPDSSTLLPCPYCSRTLCAKISLISHLCTHRNPDRRWSSS